MSASLMQTPCHLKPSAASTRFRQRKPSYISSVVTLFAPTRDSQDFSESSAGHPKSWNVPGYSSIVTWHHLNEFNMLFILTFLV